MDAPVDPAQLAALAASLLDNEAFTAVLSAMRGDALEALAAVDATNTDAIHRHQATVRVADEFRDRLKVLQRCGQPKGKPGIA